MTDWKELYRRMRNVAAGYSNHCEENGSTRKLDKEFSLVEADAREQAAQPLTATERALARHIAAQPAPEPCALCGAPARIAPTCDACHDSMGTKPKKQVSEERASLQAKARRDFS